MESIWDGVKIKEARKAAEMTAEDASGPLGVVPQYIYAVEGGKKQPSQNLIARMAEVYKVPVTSFLRTEASAVKP